MLAISDSFSTTWDRVISNIKIMIIIIENWKIMSPIFKDFKVLRPTAFCFNFVWLFDSNFSYFGDEGILMTKLSLWGTGRLKVLFIVDIFVEKNFRFVFMKAFYISTHVPERRYQKLRNALQMLLNRLIYWSMLSSKIDYLFLYPQSYFFLKMLLFYS